MRVEQLMTKIVSTCSRDDLLSRPAQIMWENDVGCVPVVDADGRLVGMITDRDIAMAAYLQGQPLTRIGVDSVMAKRVHTCGPEDTIAIGEERMRKYQVRRLPVTDATGLLLGLLSMNDIALEASRGKGARRPEVGLNDVALTLAEVCQHRGNGTLQARA